MNTSRRSSGISRLLVSMLVLTAFSTPAWGATVQINGFEMYYEITGEGEPLVLLHGFFASGQAEWGPMVGDLSKDFELIIPDLRGHGSSTNPSGAFTHRQAALDVFALLDHLDLDRVKAVGSSTGGMTLLHMATQQPDRIIAMVIHSSTIYFPDQAREMMKNIDPSNIPDERMKELREQHKHGDDQIVALMTQFNAFKDNYDDMNFTAPYLSTITARTLIVHGDRDAFFPARIGLEMYEGIPDSYLWVVPNAGHDAGIQRDPQLFIRTTTAFLKEQL